MSEKPKKKIHMVCNAHIDPIWQWDWQEGVSATLSTFRSAVKLAKKYDYIFCHNEVTVYRYVEEYDPPLFEEIKALVKQGKWRIIGGWFLQPDCNMPLGESFVRQIRYGFEYFKQKFGVEPPKTAFNVDAFGHTRGLVQIIKKCGQDSVIVCRPCTYEKRYEYNLFNWIGVDGSSIKAIRTQHNYSTKLGKAADDIRGKAEWCLDGEGLVMWGVGNHGGGPSDKDLADISNLIKTDEDFEFVHSYPEAFFAEAKPKTDLTESLHISMPGCYTSMIEVKQRHIKLENELYLAEIMSAVASAKGLLEYPKEKLRGCFEDLMTGEFHDVLPGSCVKAGEDNGLQAFDHGYIDATKIKTKAYFALMNGQPCSKDGEYPVLVFNPHPYALKTSVECEFMLADQNWSGNDLIIIVKDGESVVKSQRVKEDSTINLDWRKKVIFEAELPPMGMKRYSVYVEERPKTEGEKIEKTANKRNIIYNNGEKYVEIDKTTGLLKIYRYGGVEYVKDGFGLYMYDDNPDPWGMGPHQQKAMGENGKPFKLCEKPSGVFEGMESVQIIEDGEVYLGVEAFFEHESSKARVEYRIYKNAPEVDVKVELFFNEANKMVKMRLPAKNEGGVIGQVAFGSDELFTDGRENVYQRFVGVRSGEKVVGLINESCYGGSYFSGAFYTSLVRGATYCAHPILDRQIIPTDRFTHKIDQGVHNYSFRLVVCDENELARKALEFNRKPYAVNVFPSGINNKESEFSFNVDNKNVSLTALKKAEECEGYILRFINNFNKPATAKIEFCKASINANFGKYEVKTFRFINGTLIEEAEMCV